MSEVLISRKKTSWPRSGTFWTTVPMGRKTCVCSLFVFPLGPTGVTSWGHVLVLFTQFGVTCWRHLRYVFAPVPALCQGACSLIQRCCWRCQRPWTNPQIPTLPLYNAPSDQIHNTPPRWMNSSEGGSFRIFVNFSENTK